MEDSKKRTLIIPLPRFDKRWMYETKVWLLIGGAIASLLALYWWIAVFPYVWILDAQVEAYSWRASIHPGSQIAALGPDTGDAVKKGDLLYSVDSEWITQKQNSLQETANSLEEQLHFEKMRMDQAMQAYLAAVQGSEITGTADEFAHRHLIALEEAQNLSEKAAQDLAAVKAELALLGSEIKKLSVEAPFEGVVLSRSGEVGSATTADAPIYTLIDPKKIWIRAQIPEAQMAFASPGSIVRIRLPAFPKKEWKGTLSHIDPCAVKGFIGVKIAIEGQHPPLKPGLSAQIALKVH